MLGEFPANGLSEDYARLGFPLGRLKTGTCPRLDARTINFAILEEQPGDEPPPPFSFYTQAITQSQLPCYLTYTNAQTHAVIAQSLDRSPLYSGVIKGIGPRYCPSIEDKIKRFPDKQRHQIFLEPEGRETVEIYPNGISTSLPEDVQVALVRSIHGLEEAEIMRPGYAVEYDFRAAHGAQADFRDQARQRAVSRRADQRHDGLRRSRGPGAYGWHQCGAAGAGTPASGHQAL